MSTFRSDPDERVLRDVFAHAPELVYSAAPDGHFLFVNGAWSAALGYTSSEAVELTVDEIVGAEVRPQWATAVGMLRTGVPASEASTVFVAKNGTRVPVTGHDGRYVWCRREAQPC